MWVRSQIYVNPQVKSMSLAEPIPRESFRDPTRQLGEGVKQQS